MNQSAPFQTLTSKIAWACPWYDIRQDEIVRPDGSQGEYNVVQKDAAVWIVPLTDEAQLVLLYSYRYTVNDWCWEIPAGTRKPGQTLVEAAVEELHEEIGGRAQAMDYVGQFYTANGICNEISHLFLATGVTLGQPAPEPAEVMEIHALPLNEVLAMAHANEISDGPSALCLFLCEARLRRLAEGSRG